MKHFKNIINHNTIPNKLFVIFDYNWIYWHVLIKYNFMFQVSFKNT